MKKQDENQGKPWKILFSKHVYVSLGGWGERGNKTTATQKTNMPKETVGNLILQICILLTWREKRENQTTTVQSTRKHLTLNPNHQTLKRKTHSVSLRLLRFVSVRPCGPLSVSPRVCPCTDGLVRVDKRWTPKAGKNLFFLP